MHSTLIYRTCLAVTLCAALCLFTPARAQEPAAARQTAPPNSATQTDEEVVRISSELVQTDVMVFDKSGKFVDGLKPEQFELKVDGRAQQVIFFERVRAGTVNEDAQIAAARGAGGGPAGGAALPLDRGRTVVFFVDDLHLSASSVINIRKVLLHFIEEEIGQNDEAAVISASGQVGFLQQLTDNKSVMRAAAARINTRPYNTRDGQSPAMTETHAAAIDRNDNNVLDYFVDYILRENPLMRREMAESMVQARARTILQQSNSISLNTLYTLESVVRGFGPLPGRKVLFFISDGFLVEDNNSTLRDRMRLIADAAARAGVVIYSLDAQGLRTGMADATTSGNFDPAGRLAQADMSEISSMQSPLYTLAADTGGRALVNTNALGRVVTGALKETALYYLLAWKPEGTTGGGSPKYQRIEVGVRGRSDLRVIVRRGFFNTPPPEATTTRADANKKKQTDKKTEGETGERQLPAAERELLAALRSPTARAALPTSLAVGYVQTEKAGPVLAVSVELDRNALTYAEGEKRRADFDLLGAVVDDHGKTITRFAQKLSVTPNSSVPESQQHVLYSFQVPLAPGLYQVRAAARDERSGRTGSAMQWVEIPEIKNNRLSLSSIFIGERKAGERAAEIKPEEVQNFVLLSVDRRFARTSKMRFLTFIYNAATTPPVEPDVAIQIQIFRDDQPVFTAPLSKLKAEGITDTSRIPYMAELNLATFPSGRYILQITAIDRTAKNSASQRTNFIIE
jgi:VWFA-related protein